MADAEDPLRRLKGLVSSPALCPAGSLLPTMCLISSRADLDEIDTLFNVLFSTFAILIVFSRYPSSASCVVTATACSRGVIFPEILLGTCHSVVLDWSSLTARGSLFVVILVLLSDPDGFGRPALFSSALLPSTATSPPMRSLLLARVTSLVLFWSVLVVALGGAPDADDPPYETEG